MSAVLALHTEATAAGLVRRVVIITRVHTWLDGHAIETRDNKELGSSVSGFPTLLCPHLVGSCYLFLTGTAQQQTPFKWTKKILHTAMPANKNALIRYKTIDRCLRNRYRRWTLDDLVDACSDALYDMEGIVKGISMRTVQGDIQIMRSDKLGYNAPIEVYDNKYYRYADPDYSITDIPLTEDGYESVVKAIQLIQSTCKDKELKELGDVLAKVKDTLANILRCG